MLVFRTQARPRTRQGSKETRHKEARLGSGTELRYHLPGQGLSHKGNKHKTFPPKLNPKLKPKTKTQVTPLRNTAKRKPGARQRSSPEQRQARPGRQQVRMHLDLHDCHYLDWCLWHSPSDTRSNKAMASLQTLISKIIPSSIDRFKNHSDQYGLNLEIPNCCHYK